MMTCGVSSIGNSGLGKLRRVHAAAKRHLAPSNPVVFIKEGEGWLTFGDDIDILLTAAPLFVVAARDFARIRDKDVVKAALLNLGVWATFVEPNAKIEIPHSVDDCDEL